MNKEVMKNVLGMLASGGNGLGKRMKKRKRDEEDDSPTGAIIIEIESDDEMPMGPSIKDRLKKKARNK